MRQVRCQWCGEDPQYVAYHDEEWGVPLRDDCALFEMLCLEGAQAGLSWITVLRKRDRYRTVFHGFEIARMARMPPSEVERLLEDAGVIRHRGKLESVVSNARSALRIQQEHGSLAQFLWEFVGNEPMSHVPNGTPVARTAESDALSKALKKQGFKFVGSTICYAFMQAVGMTNDHAAGCFRRPECDALRAYAHRRARV